jgi:hypothetical protein
VLELETADGTLRLEVDRGRVKLPTKDELANAGRTLACRDGRFRFLPGEIDPLEGDAISLSAFADAAGGVAAHGELDRLLVEELLEPAQPTTTMKINVLPAEPLENPLDDLMTDLEVGPYDELLVANIAVITYDPRWWRGSLERSWQFQGWRIRHMSLADAADLGDVDVLIVHHQSSSAWVGNEDEWIDLLARAREQEPPVPVVWISPVGDSAWVYRLIEHGVGFLVPAPQGDVGEPMARFTEALSTVVARQIRLRPKTDALPSGVADLVGALLSESEPDRGVSSLLHLAAEHFARGAVLMADQDCLRCRAGFGFPLDRDHTTLPRGIDVLERVVVDGEAVMEIEAGSTVERELAAVLGVDSLARATAMIPLGRSGTVAGILVADREGKALPDLADLVRLAGRLGGAVVL